MPDPQAEGVFDWRDPFDVLLGDALRGFLMEKGVPFDQLDEWSDALMAIVKDHGWTYPEYA